jgi:hypothetical protein
MGSNIQYSRCIWGHYVAKNFDRDVMRRAWEEMRTVPPLQAMDNALSAAPYSSSFRQAFSEWVLWNFFTSFRADTTHYYIEGQLYPPMTQSSVGFTPPSRALAGSLAPLAARYYQVLGLPDTLTLALPNINFEAGIAGTTSEYPYNVLLNNQRIDESYSSTPVGLYYKLDVADPINWARPWAIVGTGVVASSIPAGIPFPNPFLVDGGTNAYIPINASTPVEGQLSIYTSSLELVFRQGLTSKARQGKQSFAWDGRTNNGEIAKTGVYFFVLEIGNETLKGKLAVVRK